MTASEITLDLMTYIGVRQNLLVPNVSWGLFHLREVDLLKITPAGYAHEFEIKISLSDLKRDHDKRPSKLIEQLIRSKTYVMPEHMRPHMDHVPEGAGIWLIRDQAFTSEHICRRLDIVRIAETNKAARKLTGREQYQVARLGAMRIRGLLEKVIRLSSRGEG